VPSGWQLLDSTASTYASWVYYKKLVSDDLTNISFQWAQSTKTLAVAVTYYGQHSTSPIATNAKYAVTTAANSMGVGSITTTTPFLVYFASKYATTARYTATASGYTERHDVGSQSPDFWQAIGDRGDWVSGASDPTVSIYSNSGETTLATATYRFGFHVAITAEPSGTTYQQSASVAATAVPGATRVGLFSRVLDAASSVVASVSRVATLYRSAAVASSVGVSVLKVVATIETPISHQGAERPEVKNSAVLEPARRARNSAGMKAAASATTTINQSRLVSSIRRPSCRA
jgi:hypothetical protein